MRRGQQTIRSEESRLFLFCRRRQLVGGGGGAVAIADRLGGSGNSGGRSRRENAGRSLIVPWHYVPLNLNLLLLRLLQLPVNIRTFQQLPLPLLAVGEVVWRISSRVGIRSGGQLSSAFRTGQRRILGGRVDGPERQSAVAFE